jgi:hypothetical protein
MELTPKRTLQTLSILLFLAVLTQAIYTLLYLSAQDIPRQWIWSLEGLIFLLLAPLAGSALAQLKQYALGFSALFASSILNVVQVGVGLTQFGPFREASNAVEGMAPAAAAVVAFSFFVYNAAKVLLGLAAVSFGVVKFGEGAKALGSVTVLLGFVAFVSNALVMMFGRMELIPSGVAGVMATLLLAVCLLSLSRE